MARECPNRDCVVAITKQSLAVLKDAKADRAAKAEALPYVVHFVGDLHQPLQDQHNGDKGGNGGHEVLDRRPDNLHWTWDTGLLNHIHRSPSRSLRSWKARSPRGIRDGSGPNIALTALEGIGSIRILSWWSGFSRLRPTWLKPRNNL